MAIENWQLEEINLIMDRLIEQHHKGLIRLEDFPDVVSRWVDSMKECVETEGNDDG